MVAMCGSSSATTFGVNAVATADRKRVCRGGSIAVSSPSANVAASGYTRLSSEENIAGSPSTCATLS